MEINPQLGVSNLNYGIISLKIWETSVNIKTERNKKVNT